MNDHPLGQSGTTSGRAETRSGIYGEGYRAGHMQGQHEGRRRERTVLVQVLVAEAAQRQNEGIYDGLCAAAALIRRMGVDPMPTHPRPTLVTEETP